MIPQLGLYDFSATESERIVRVPLFFNLTEDEVERNLTNINNYYNF